MLLVFHNPHLFLLLLHEPAHAIMIGKFRGEGEQKGNEKRNTVQMMLHALNFVSHNSLQLISVFCPPAYLCLDTLYVGCEGEVLFLKPKNIGRFTFVSSLTGLV